MTLWADNETTIDLLGFTPWVETVAELVTSSDMLPVTVGIFSDWGGGKSSLMGMLRESLIDKDGIVTIEFQPWLHRSYDDVRGALMVAIVDALAARVSTLERASKVVSAVAKSSLMTFARRVDWLRFMKFGFKAVGALGTMFHTPPIAIALGAGAVSDLPHLLSDPEHVDDANDGAEDGRTKGLFKPQKGEIVVQNAAPPVERAISEFRDEFKALLKHLNVTSLVVLVDDLDRCSPTTILDTLEAIKLFFAVPRTAFVIGADERIIRHALEKRYPETGPLATTLGREYLEKIIQVPIRIPPLTPAELETYMKLLVLERHIGRQPDVSNFGKLRALTLQRIRSGFAADALNYSLVEETLNVVPRELGADIALVEQVAPVLAPQLKGNPRQAKRFLNLVFLRGRLAKGLGIASDMPVLAKLAALEYFDEDAFATIASWNSESPGASAHVRALEALTRGESEPTGPDAEALQRFAARPRLRKWLASEPSIGSVDITPYVNFAREKLRNFGAVERSLPPRLQDVLVSVLDEATAVAASGLERARTLDDADQELLFNALLARLPTADVTPAHVDAILGLVSGAPSRPSNFAAALQGLAPEAVPIDLPITVRARVPELMAPFLELFTRWSMLTDYPILAASARKAIAPRPAFRKGR